MQEPEGYLFCDVQYDDPDGNRDEPEGNNSWAVEPEDYKRRAVEPERKMRRAVEPEGDESWAVEPEGYKRRAIEAECNIIIIINDKSERTELNVNNTRVPRGYIYVTFRVWISRCATSIRAKHNIWIQSNNTHWHEL